MQPAEKIRILFVAENITTSQVVRLALLAKNLNPEKYEVHFACSAFEPVIFADTNFCYWEIFSIDKKIALKRTEKGRRIYDEDMLEGYMAEELQLFKKIKPHVVVGDFRLSLCISTAIAKIPFINLINAYWHPEIQQERFPVPEHPIIHLLGLRITKLYYPVARSFVFDYFAWPVNTLREKYGLPEIGSLCEVLTYGDRVIFPDAAELMPLNPSAKFSFIGPLIWSPECEEEIPETTAEQLIYVTAGSSGSAKIIDAVVKALENSPYVAVISMAGEQHNYVDTERIKFTDYVDGNKVIEKASLVICNGGSSTAYQALAKGKPLIGIPSNLDQHLAMEFIVEAGAGISIRSDQLSAENIVNAIQEILEKPSYKSSSEKLQRSFGSYSPHKAFNQILTELLQEGEFNDNTRSLEFSAL